MGLMPVRAELEEAEAAVAGRVRSIPSTGLLIMYTFGVCWGVLG